MKLKFKVQPYQTDAVEAIVDCFAGQSARPTVRYQIGSSDGDLLSALGDGFRNEEVDLGPGQLLTNIQAVQRRQNLSLSRSLTDFSTLDGKGQRGIARRSYKPGAGVNLDVEMETGTGKTYCYIKTMFEMQKRYGWSKFIVIVPSIAIREGVLKSFHMTADHFADSYGKRARYFVYNSKRLHEIESFSSDSGLNVLIINIQAFNARGADNRRIYEELDDFQSRRPIDVIGQNRPILILDEPQKMEGKATLDALPKFNPLFIVRYSATHRTQHNLVHRLDALDAYNRKLVKKIAVRGVQTKGLPGSNAYLYLEGIEISSRAPLARVEMEVKLASGEIKRRTKRLQFGADLFVKSGGLDQYRGFVISDIDYNRDEVEFTNGIVLLAGEATGDVSESDIRRIQIRETIRAHLEKEEQLFHRGIKVLSLFFIDEVAKYRDYKRTDQNGEYAQTFEQEYTRLVQELLESPTADRHPYRNYLAGIGAAATHNGYFSIDKKTRRMKDPSTKKRGEAAGLSDDVEAYDLILKDKEHLLSFTEQTRFIFSHSALREGWDNPNVFIMCMLKHSDNTISRRQEVGRGLRLSVDQNGDRIDQVAIVHDVNVLTVVASESYRDFVTGLQAEVAQALSARPQEANEDYFAGKTLHVDGRTVVVTPKVAKQIYRYLIKNDYTDDDDHITEKYRAARDAAELAELPVELHPLGDQIFNLIDSVFDESQLPRIDDGRKPKTNRLNANFQKAEFQELWSRINRRCVYRVDFQSDELIRKAVATIDQHLHVTQLQYVVQSGQQVSDVTDAQVRSGQTFQATHSATHRSGPVESRVTYDLVGKIAENTHLTRKTIACILAGLDTPVFGQFAINPEHFISQVSRLIGEQKATTIIEQLRYNAIEDRHDVGIFTAAQTGQDFARATHKLKNHVYDYCITDSDVERRFVEDLDTASEVIVYAKLPRGFLIPTPVGDYNPDWAISLERDFVRHIYFVAETKGSMSSMELRGVEKTKIDCARKFFAELSEGSLTQPVRYDVVTDFGQLIDLVSGTESA